jgi:hypothetical protein
MTAIRRFAVEGPCAGCGRGNVMLIPEGCCGNEFVWHVRCRACGAWRWFHSREDVAFGRAVRETAKRRGEPGGLSAEGTREAHAAYEATLPACGCGGRFQVAFELTAEPCTGCGRPLGPSFIGAGKRITVDVPGVS